MKTFPSYRTEGEAEFDRYQVGGSLAENAPTYVERPADRDLYKALKRGEFCYVLNSRQMGKSSLMVRTRFRLEAEGFKCVTVDMTNIGSENITPLQWYKGMAAELWSGFQLLGKLNFKQWWKDRDDYSLVQKLSRFIEHILFEQFPQDRLFIFIDEIDSILSLDFSIDDFFALIRFVYNQRALNPNYNRLTFAIFGVAAPSDLICDKTRTPFNIGRAIQLEGFTIEQSQPLARGLNLPNAENKAVIAEILKWTGGQPFLTQKLCQLICRELQHPETQFNLRQHKAQTVENLVRSRAIENWESQDEPEHFRTIRDRLLRNPRSRGRLLGLYQHILSENSITVKDLPEHLELLLSGLVIERQGRLLVKNPIYRAIFNSQWVAQQLENLRPYAQNLSVWLASHEQDESQLLEGIALHAALTWARDKKLPNSDYRFLAASQDLRERILEDRLATEKVQREKAQFALEAAKKANVLLSQARQQVRRKAKTLRLGKNWVLGITLATACFVLLLRFAGFWQGMEWAMLDRFFQLRPAAAIDPRVVVVTIDEPDIRAIRKYPLSDRILVRALEQLKAAQPRVIGLDLYRDLPVEPGYGALADLFQTTPNLIGIEKIVGSQVAPPPVLNRLGQVGFADQVLDGDGKVRRALLSLRPSDGKVRPSLSLLLALRYLEKEGIREKPLSDGRKGTLRLGRTRLIPFQGDDGGYVRADDGGYQILLNFRGTQEQFATFSFTELLAGEVPRQAMSDRVVLLGATAQSVNDLFQVPGGDRFAGPPHQMAGVTLHANITSQILSAALDGRPMLYPWPPVAQWLWIALGCALGTGLSWRIESSQGIAIAVFLAGGGLVAVAYGFFLQGSWLPVVPALVGLGISAIALPLATAKQLESIKLYQTVELLVAMTREEPIAGQIAIESLKQGESPENQAAIERWVANSYQ
ncbi:MAG: CHASE2 domain-containing protein [Cyanobacteriota bacterium]|nr:CHASE2 domain-containing protein [Cyanobacteriota bacterium]